MTEAAPDLDRSLWNAVREFATARHESEDAKQAALALCEWALTKGYPVAHGGEYEAS